MTFFSFALIAQVRPFNPGGANPEVITAPGQAVADVATLAGLEAIFNNVVAVSLGLAGIVFFIMLIASAFTLMTAGGEPPKIQAARKSLTVALVGFVLVLLAFLIITLVSKFTGNTNILDFKIIGT